MSWAEEWRDTGGDLPMIKSVHVPGARTTELGVMRGKIEER